MPLFDSLYNFARWLTHNSNDAEDLVQETYLKALRSFASFQPGTNFRAWIFQILRNTFLSSCSKVERRMTVGMDSEEEILRQRVPAAVVLDLPSPGSSGRDLCKTIANLIPGLPLVVLSASSNVADKVLPLEMAADDYVTVPFSPRELVARLRALDVHRASVRKTRMSSRM
jgi:RNA polymerase sigma factor (sigma-70 family)